MSSRDAGSQGGLRQRHTAPNSTSHNSNSNNNNNTNNATDSDSKRQRSRFTTFTWTTAVLYVLIFVVFSVPLYYIGKGCITDTALKLSGYRTDRLLEAFQWYVADRSEGLRVSYPVSPTVAVQNAAVRAANARLFARVAASGAFTQLHWPDRDIYVRPLQRRVPLNATTGMPESTIPGQKALFASLAAEQPPARAAATFGSDEASSLVTWGLAEINPFTNRITTDGTHLAPIRCMTEDADATLHVKGTTSGRVDFLNTYQKGSPSRMTMVGVDHCLGFLLSLMCVGDKWEIVCGPQSANGVNGMTSSNILPHQAVVYVVDLRSVRQPSHALERNAATIQWPIRLATRRLARLRARAHLSGPNATAAEKAKADEALRTFSRADLLATAKTHLFETLWD